MGHPLAAIDQKAGTGAIRVTVARQLKTLRQHPTSELEVQ